MLFNSFQFPVFLIIVFSLYWSIKNINCRNVILLAASYFFYGYWDYRFLSLIFFSSVSDYFIGLFISRSSIKLHRRLLLTLSLVINLGVLAFFKYFNFFAESLQILSGKLGFQVHYYMIEVILPVGISFYTFQTLSYTIDIYRRRLEPTRDVISFFTYVSFFPQLVAGPIERASHLLPQFQTLHTFNRKNAEDGLKQMLWGFFKKMIIADNAAIVVNEIFNNYSNSSNSVLLLGAFLFSFQIYADFSGYSDIAIGVSKLFGIELMINFKTPYFAKNIIDFWRRWHISLSTWFRDYIYIPVGGSKNGVLRYLLSVILTFGLSGLWHGANFTFIAWGLIHATLYLIQVVIDKFLYQKIDLKHPLLKSLYSGIGICITFLTVMLTWVIFRAEKISDAFRYIKMIFIKNHSPEIYFSKLWLGFNIKVVLIFIGIQIIVEWFTRYKTHPFEAINKFGYARYLVYIMAIIFIFLFTPGQKSDFIYFQF